MLMQNFNKITWKLRELSFFENTFLGEKSWMIQFFLQIMHKPWEIIYITKKITTDYWHFTITCQISAHRNVFLTELRSLRCYWWIESLNIKRLIVLSNWTASTVLTNEVCRDDHLTSHFTPCHTKPLVPTHYNWWL